GMVYVYFARNYNGNIHLSHKLSIWENLETSTNILDYKNIYKNNITSLTSKTPNSTGPVTSLSWTSDGHAIAVGWQNEGLAIWSVYGKLLMTTIRDDWPNSIPNNQDKFLNGVNDL
ncbi:14905_t:CDS:2, partial [Entrophospora sp. SA101]